MAGLLGQIGYSSSITLALGFDAADFPRPPAGFGFLIPKKERRRLAACTWVGTKFSHRVPDGKIVARCFLPESTETDETIIREVTSELQEIAGFTAGPRFARIFRWPRAMAQYPVGHPQKLAEIRSRQAAVPGLYLAGNAYEGIGIPDCIRMGKRAADQIAAAAVPLGR